MHKVNVRQEIIDRVLARRGRYHWFEELDPRRTALVIIDMQELFCAPGAPAEVPGSRDIVEPINKLTEELRKIGVPVIWVLHANSQTGGRSDWELFFNYIVADDVREKTKQSLAPGRQQVWSGLTVDPADTKVIKNRYSALIPGSSGPRTTAAQPRHRHRARCRHQDQYLLRGDRPRRHDARLQGGDGLGLLRSLVRRRTSLRAGEHDSAVRRRHDRR